MVACRALGQDFYDLRVGHIGDLLEFGYLLNAHIASVSQKFNRILSGHLQKLLEANFLELSDCFVVFGSGTTILSLIRASTLIARLLIHL